MKAFSVLLFFIFSIILSTCQCFVVHHSISKPVRCHYQTPPSQNDETILLLLIDDSLRPPPINLRKESILFDSNSATMAKNNALRVWQFMRRRLPLIVTGTHSDANPWGAMYNTLLVRLPTLGAGVVYAKNIIQGHPLIVDLGDGPFEVPSLVVLGILGTILRVPKQTQRNE